MKEEKAKIKIHQVTLHVPRNFPDAKGNPTGATTHTFGAANSNGGPTYLIEPHPMGVKIKKDSSDKVALVVPHSNISGMIVIEE